MDITWLGHSCFRIRSGNSAILTDPFPPSIGLSMGTVDVLAVTVSHQEENHNYVQGIEGTYNIIDRPGEYEYSGIYFTGVMTPPSDGDATGFFNTAFLIEMGNLRICHLGDIQGSLGTKQLETLAPVDILFLPVGGQCTVDIPRAIQITQAMEPRIVLPMHYAIPGLKVELNGIDVFLKEMGLKDVQHQPRLSVSPTNLPPERRIVLLENQANLI